MAKGILAGPIRYNKDIIKKIQYRFSFIIVLNIIIVDILTNIISSTVFPKFIIFIGHIFI